MADTYFTREMTTLLRGSSKVRSPVGPLLVGALFSALALGCRAEDALSRSGPQGWVGTAAPSGVLPLPFVVDDHFHPSNCFDDTDGCKTVVYNAKGCGPGGLARPEGAQGQCYGYEYHSSGTGFGGVFSVYHPDGAANWGDVEGRAVAPGARKLSFFAAAAPGSAPEPKVYFKVGIADPSKPYRDTLKIDPEQPIVLSPNFEKYEFLLEGQSYEKVIAAFGWTMLGADGQGTFRFFVDDVRWE